MSKRRMTEEELELVRRVKDRDEPIYGGVSTMLLDEIDALRVEVEDARRWAVRYEQMLHAERKAAYDLLLAATSDQPMFSPPVDTASSGPPSELVLVRVEIDNWNVSSNEDGPYGSIDAEIKVVGGDGLLALVKLLETEPEKLHIVGRR